MCPPYRPDSVTRMVLTKTLLVRLRSVQGRNPVACIGRSRPRSIGAASERALSRLSSRRTLAELVEVHLVGGAAHHRSCRSTSGPRGRLHPRATVVPEAADVGSAAEADAEHHPAIRQLIERRRGQCQQPWLVGRRRRDPGSKLIRSVRAAIAPRITHGSVEPSVIESLTNTPSLHLDDTQQGQPRCRRVMAEMAGRTIHVCLWQVELPLLP
jgi:hypothetical protein